MAHLPAPRRPRAPSTPVNRATALRPGQSPYTLSTAYASDEAYVAAVLLLIGLAGILLSLVVVQGTGQPSALSELCADWLCS